ncbi:hypothetical protein BYT27DRAFT_7123076 [Phlegmacium glaucopus]|nr:hypothetical protein BYT27DRAFT_7123076 [Phlegmacium glaucopus]
MSSESLELVPLFDGTNYTSWATTMAAYLKMQGLWQITKGSVNRPQSPAISASDAAAVATRVAIRLWDLKDDQALGTIMLRLAESVRHEEGATSYMTWQNLEKSYAKQRPSLIFADFKEATSFRISGNGNPIPEMDKLFTLLERLKANEVELPARIQAMILLNAMPQKWNGVVSNYLLTRKVEDLTFADVHTTIICEYQRTNPAYKISAIKRKGEFHQFKN